MAWMRRMGAEPVAYHQATVLERGDDHPGQALAYWRFVASERGLVTVSRLVGGILSKKASEQHFCSGKNRPVLSWSSARRPRRPQMTIRSGLNDEAPLVSAACEPTVSV